MGGLFEAAAGAIENLGKSPRGMPGRILEETAPWLLNFSTSATARWLPTLAKALPCDIKRATPKGPIACTNHAISECCACKSKCCIHHGCADQFGAVICYGCVADQIKLKTGKEPVMDPRTGSAPPAPPGDADDRQAPVPPAMRAQRTKAAFHELGLPESASWTAIDKAWKARSKTHHPDRFQNPADKARHEEIYKRTQAAYADLERFYPRKKAA